MEVPCVRVEREEGETARRRLAERDVLANDFEITVEDGWLYIPVDDPDAVPEEYEVVERAPPARERPEMPADLLGYEPSYERLGEIVILDEDDPERAAEIAQAVMDSALPARTVLNRASKIRGELRVRDWDVLAGDGTETVHREYGFEYALDLAAVYFSPRLATERHRVVEQVHEGERVLDMFAGVGPFVIPAAARSAEAVGVDLNEHAIEYLEENARRNGVADRVTAIRGDVRNVVAGSSGGRQPSNGIGDLSASASGSEPNGPDDGYEDWADRIVMNLPHSADAFLETAVALAGDTCVLHYYDIQHEDDPFGPGERAIREAAEPEYEVSVEERTVVRSYAPHELNVCLDVRLSR
ncbi:class I SAM-dependent methyltransferase [Halalkalicoccus ordinarius]|uniref:class I SAM-dependent methyltransferase n=1 Tax=Halalkalicoccus ordinarius TaxID=3116651 RepID=UPI00300E7D0F